ncbi:CopG family transcriptional regulator [uncultured Amnibacterium sp.]|uniref:CopG family transcriptional regulator n=1 Tax=uncultured Amnibacterium sp. TaxID=1631851 RepID=UPI0035CCA74B
MTLRLSPAEDETLARLARQFRVSKNQAAAQAIDLAAPKRNHPEFVQRTTRRLISQYDDLLSRLEQA